jgi:bifunctional ADP-heptose synthase (sugar kinase/adenylyltransferase)
VKHEKKVSALPSLEAVVKQCRAEGKRVVHARGLFDLLQPSHVRKLEAARADGDVLIVTVAHDSPHGEAPILDARLRAETLAAIPCVDYVALEENRSEAECARILRPDVVVRLFDEAVPSSDPTPKAPSSAIHVLDGTSAPRAKVVYEEREPFTPQAEKFLHDFRKRHRASEIVDRLQSLKKMKVLVLGDAIIDEYHFVRPYGMPQKAPVIAAQFMGEEQYAGGVLAVANHVAGFCGDVHLVTCLGEEDSRERFILDHLRPNVSSQFFKVPGAPTTIKRRYLRKFLLQKLFEIAFFDDRPLPPAVDAEVRAHLGRVISGYDLVVVADFGHGMFTRPLVDALCASDRFLAVNTQLNSINFGYHVIRKYPRADYVCIDEEETRMACRDRFGPLEEMIPPLAKELACKVMTVTRGHHGSTTYKRGDEMVAVPVLSRQVVDTVGAGDAYLSVTAPCARAGFTPEMIGFIGNSVGALAVRIVGNQQPVEPEALFDFVRVLMR